MRGALKLSSLALINPPIRKQADDKSCRGSRTFHWSVGESGVSLRGISCKVCWSSRAGNERGSMILIGVTGIISLEFSVMFPDYAVS